jgi:hypothetical protein
MSLPLYPWGRTHEGRIFGPKNEEIMGGKRKLHNDELYNLYSSYNLTSMITSGKIRLADHVAWI